MLLPLLCTAILGGVAMMTAVLWDLPQVKPAAMKALNRLKRGRGPLIVKIVAGSVLVVLVSRVYSTINAAKRFSMLNPTVLMYMCQIALMGFFLFLFLMLDRLRCYKRKESFLRTKIAAAIKQNQSYQGETDKRAMELKNLGQEVAKFRTQVSNMELEYVVKAKETELEKIKLYALRKQYKGLLMDFDRLQEDNHVLRSQVEWTDQTSDDTTEHMRKRLH